MALNRLLLLAFSALVALNQAGAERGDELWAFTEVRPGANMFWWLMDSTSLLSQETRPLIVWLSGGPGASGTGWGNFEELGPLDWNNEPRNVTWLNHAHLLFVDSPVGTGFSTVDSPDLFSGTAQEIAQDLLVMFKDVLRLRPDLIPCPVYILGESMGGRMGPVFAQELNRAVKAGEIDANLSTLIIRDGFTHPETQIPSFVSYVFETGLIGLEHYNALQETMKNALDAIANEDYITAEQYYLELRSKVTAQSYGASYFYILATEPPLFSNTSRAVRSLSYKQYNQDPLDEQQLQQFMNTVVKPKLETRTPNLREWLAFNQDIQDAAIATGDRMRSTRSVVDELLKTTNIKVAVINGQLDGIVPTAGVLRWMEALTWSGIEEWKSRQRVPLVVDNVVEGYVKQTDRLSMWWINRAGHETFYHNPIAGYQVIQLLSGIL